MAKAKKKSELTKEELVKLETLELELKESRRKIYNLKRRRNQSFELITELYSEANRSCDIRHKMNHILYDLPCCSD